jgi:hypothetical protein
MKKFLLILSILMLFCAFQIVSAKAVSGNLLLRPFAEKAVLKAKFNPINDVGRILVKGTLVYDFKSKSN